ncbi:MAG TPA: metal-dependent hydrolase [Vicinamibacterales bacterium]|nr:metal-dependent hydrolase [Vicinamibacterales bacterium]
MPSPVGHALGGLIVGVVVGDREPGAVRPWALALPVIAAVAPDIDFLWGRHNMETHSLGAALLAGLAVLAWTRGRGPGLALAVALAWSSHVLFDWLGSDTTPPLGVMALWPLSSDFYFANAFLFDAISRRTYRPDFWSHNLWAVAKEVVMLAPVAGAAWALRRRPSSDR